MSASPAGAVPPGWVIAPIGRYPSPSTLDTTPAVAIRRVVIWFSVRVPVLSEQIAEVEPSVSVELRSFTTALCAARSRVPIDSSVVTTVGRPVGIAPIATVTASRNRSSRGRPRAEPATTITKIVPAASQAKTLASWFIWRCSGDASALTSPSIPAMWPISVDMAVSVTTNVPVPRVTWVFMYAMSMTVTEGDVGVVGHHDLSGLLGGGLALAGEGGLLDLERGSAEHATVGGHEVAGLERDDVARDQVAGVDLDDLTAAPHPGGHLHHLGEGGHGGLGLGLLAVAHRGVEEGQPEQQRRGGLLVDHEADDRRAEQQQLHEVAVLGEEHAPRGDLGGLVELVRAVLGPPTGGLVGVQPTRCVDVESVEHVVGGEGVPAGPLVSGGPGRRHGAPRRRGCARSGHERASSLPQMTDDRPLRIATLCGSLRRGSFNRALLGAAIDAAPAGVEFVEVAIRALPPYDEDLERGEGDDAERTMRAALADADGLLVATPEYNHSMPGPAEERPGLGVTPAARRAAAHDTRRGDGHRLGRGAPDRSIEATRETLVLCGAQLLDPPPLSLAGGRDKVVVDDAGDPTLQDDEASDAVSAFMDRFLEHVRAGRRPA